MRTPDFCNAFDSLLAEQGPAAVFLPDREGLFRMDTEWTRDAWTRHPGPHVHGWTWTLVRDRLTGFVTLVLVTSPTLLPVHHEGDVRTFPSLDAAELARAAFGEPPVAEAPW